MKELKTVAFTNEKGNPRPSVQRELKLQVSKHFLGDFEKAENGKFYTPIARDENTGKTIYAVCEMVVTNNPSLDKKENKAKAKIDDVEIPSLFD